MTMTDPIADMLTRIRNGLHARKKSIQVPASGLKKSILTVLKDEGYIIDFTDSKDAGDKPALTIELKYYQGQSVIQKIDRDSKPGLRHYSAAKEIPMVANGLGVSIVSTSKGVVSDTKAREMNVGGEVLCQVF